MAKGARPLDDRHLGWSLGPASYQLGPLSCAMASSLMEPQTPP